jgi:ABC-2 type transport system ATP-binding protein
MNASPLIQVEDFHKTYGDTVAVRGLNFTVQAGEILGLIGANGAGKTTTLRALCGIFPATTGRLRVAGHDVARAPLQAKRALAYVPDDPRLFDALTVWEHLQLTAAIYEVSGWKERAPVLLGQLELEEKREALCQDLSRGMRQKVAIACAFLHAPQVLLLDEPLTGLDPRGIRTMKEALVQQARAGAAVILSSHLLSLVEDLCTHYLILRKGERVFLGSIAEARAAFTDLKGDASLEELFFHATEREPALPPPLP